MNWRVQVILKPNRVRCSLKQGRAVPTCTQRGRAPSRPIYMGCHPVFTYKMPPFLLQYMYCSVLRCIAVVFCTYSEVYRNERHDTKCIKYVFLMYQNCIACIVNCIRVFRWYSWQYLCITCVFWSIMSVLSVYFQHDADWEGCDTCVAVKHIWYTSDTCYCYLVLYRKMYQLRIRIIILIHAVDT